MEINKIDDNQIEVVKTEQVTTKATFTYEYLIWQRDAIQYQKDRENALRDAELLEIDELLKWCEKLSVTAKVEEVPVEVTPIEETIEPIDIIEPIKEDVVLEDNI